MSAIEQYEHDPQRCAVGKCRHAVSERVPCRCRDCDATTAEMVAEYREIAAAGIAAREAATARIAGKSAQKQRSDG